MKSPQNSQAFVLCLLLSLVACSPQQPPGEAGSAAGNSVDDGRKTINLIINGDYVVSMDADASVYQDAAVAVHEGVILAIGTQADISATYSATESLAGDGRIVMPGLINGHSHAAMTLLRGVADDLELMDWLNNYIFPAEVEFVDPEFVRIGTELACWEMIRGGTTTFVDMYYYPDVIADVVDNCGMRALISATVIDQRSPDAENADDSISKGLAFIDRWKGKNSRIMPIFGPTRITR
jgi:5-methylthioadenosine/S-adenosylhomocysteine deaminase